MSDKKLEIVITRAEKPEATENRQSKEARRGIIPRKKEGDYLKRRKPPAGINFYDVGYLRNGNSLYASFLPSITYSTTQDATVAPISDEQKAALVSELEALIFATAAENFTSSYHKINKSEVYEKAIFVSFPNGDGVVSGRLSEIDQWTSAGLKLKNENLAGFELSTDGFLFDSLDLNFSAPGDAGIKITATFDVNAPDAAFTPGLKMDVFLMPSLIFHSAIVIYNDGFHTYTNGGTTISSLISKKEILNNNYSTLPRHLYDDLIAAFEHAPGSYSRDYGLIKLIAQMPEARALRGVTDFVETPPYDYFFSWSNFSPTAFPFPTVYTPTGIDNSGAPIVEDISRGVNLGELDLNRLIMIIKKNNEYFYFWRVD